jgi:predicted ATPase
LSDQVGDAPELSPGLFGLWAIYNSRGEIRTSYPIAQQLLSRAQRANDSALLMYANVTIGNTLFDRGELALALKYLEQAISLYDRERYHRLAPLYGSLDAGVWALFLKSFSLWELGYPAQAIRTGNEMLALARELPHPPSLAFAEVCLGILHWLRREPHETLVAEERGIALSGDQGLDNFIVATMWRGWAMAQEGRDEEGIAQIREGLDKMRETGSLANRPLCLGMLAEVYIKADLLEDALSALAEAEALAAQNDHRPFLEAETHRLRGELLLKRNGSNAAEAESCFEQAIEIARKYNAKSRELRAAISLARLLGRQRPEEGRATLSHTYDWFTEGFDTSDLKDAKALLDELSA